MKPHLAKRSRTLINFFASVITGAAFWKKSRYRSLLYSIAKEVQKLRPAVSWTHLPNGSRNSCSNRPKPKKNLPFKKTSRKQKKQFLTPMQQVRCEFWQISRFGARFLRHMRTYKKIFFISNFAVSISIATAPTCSKVAYCNRLPIYRLTSGSVLLLVNSYPSGLRTGEMYQFNSRTYCVICGSLPFLVAS